MKLLIFVCIFSTLTIIIPKVHGDVVVDLFGKIQESVKKIGDDMKIVFQSNERWNNQYKYRPAKVTQNEGYDADKIVFERPATTTPVPVTTAQAPVTIAQAPVTTTQASMTTVKNAAKGNGTEQDGRENFRGACATGYVRTADGRCKPTF